MTEANRGPRRAAVAFILVTVVLDVLAFGVTIPVLPKLVEQFTAGDTPAAARIFGLFGTVWALMQFVSAPVLGALSDRFGRRPILLVSLLGLGLDYLLMAVAPSLGWLFVGRVLSGVLAANWGTAAAYLSDVTPAEQRAAAFGMIGAAWGFGFVVGPAIGGILGQTSPRLPFWIAGALTLVNAVYGFFILPESLPADRRRPFDLRQANPWGSLTMLRSKPGLLGLSTVYFLYQLAHNALPSVFVLWAGYRLGWGARAVGISLAVVGVATIVVQAGLVGPMVKRLGERGSLLLGLVAGAAEFAMIGLARTPALVWIGIAVGAFAGLFNPALQGLMSRRVDGSEQGQLQGANSAIMGIAGMLGPWLFTRIFAQFISPEAPVLIPGAPFYLAALIVVAALLVAARTTTPDLNGTATPAR